RWKRWLEHDPILLVDKYKNNLKTLKGIYIDCGWRDQYHIHYGTRLLSLRLAEAGVAHMYQEFDDNHSDVDYRMDVSLPFLYRAVKPGKSQKKLMCSADASSPARSNREPASIATVAATPAPMTWDCTSYASGLRPSYS